ncbi:hypothetical protein BDZ45DRAFT_652263 [Acephala macrosclerotiorum]|nr:hypothetical protein BDZ45DRAFT_652263 [Acephala macrosclerotiorum]
MNPTSIFSPINGPGGQSKLSGNVPSFGIELEFLVGLLPDGSTDPDPQDPHIRSGIYPFPLEVEHHIAKNLNKTFKTQIYTTTKELEQPFWAYVPFGNIDSKAEEDAFGRSAHVEHLVSTYRTKVNQTCGMHIHIGCQQADFELQHLKSIMAIIWTFEKRFYQLVSEDRSTNTSYTGLLNTGSRLGEETAGPVEGLERILAAESVSELAHMLTDPYWIRLGFNIRDLDPLCTKSFNPKPTLEIRIHEGTLDPEAFMNWIPLWTWISQFAEVVNTENLNKWLREHINDAEEDYDAFQLLNALKLHRQAHYYATKVLDPLSLHGQGSLLGKAALIEVFGSESPRDLSKFDQPLL